MSSPCLCVSVLCVSPVCVSAYVFVCVLRVLSYVSVCPLYGVSFLVSVCGSWHLAGWGGRGWGVWVRYCVALIVKDSLRLPQMGVSDGEVSRGSPVARWSNCQAGKHIRRAGTDPKVLVDHHEKRVGT